MHEILEYPLSWEGSLNSFPVLLYAGHNWEEGEIYSQMDGLYELQVLHRPDCVKDMHMCAGYHELDDRTMAWHLVGCCYVIN